MSKGNKIRYWKAFLLGVIFVCLYQIGQAYCRSAEHQRKQEEWKQMMKVEEAHADTGRMEAERAHADVEKAEVSDLENGETETGREEKKAVCASGIPGEEGGYPILDRYQALYIQNGDLVGWLSIDGMKIDYPVMQCEDDEYYLHHDFEGEDSKYGCLYVRERADLEEGTNFVIYGHNMKDGSMFGDLDFYREEDFYKEHSKISFDTLYKEYTYEIVAVFLSQIYNENDDVFKYYQFYEAETEAEFRDFYEHIKEMSLYDTGVEAVYGDHFLTLSTCAYHVKNGRLAVVAKRVE